MMKFVLLVVWLLSSPVQAATPNILVLGDSLSAAYGIDQDSGWVALLQRRLEKQQWPHRVINASISGETSSGGLRRLPELLQAHQPEIVLIELGGNDGLRGQSIAQLQDNLAQMLRLCQAQGAQVLQFEMRIPPNYGPRYSEAFQQVFSKLAQEYRVPLVPFFLAPIATDAGLFQDDGIHPTAQAQPILLDQVWPRLQPLLETAMQAKALDDSAPGRAAISGRE